MKFSCFYFRQGSRGCLPPMAVNTSLMKLFAQNVSLVYGNKHVIQVQN